MRISMKALLMKNKKETLGVISQKRADEIFRDININVNGFYLMNYSHIGH